MASTVSSTRIAYLKETIKALEDGYDSGALVLEYSNAGRLEQCNRIDYEARIRQFYVQYAKLTDDAEFLKQVQNNIRNVRVVGPPLRSRPRPWLLLADGRQDAGIDLRRRLPDRADRR